ncbi:MAG: phosphoenolpyruvate carboxykinase [Candidatus Hodarchaeota archaeon]
MKKINNTEDYHIKIIDLQERNELIELAERYLGYDSLFKWNANINGFIIQLRTNDAQLDDLWRENWFPASNAPNTRPHAVIYAVSGVYDTEPSINYHSDSKICILININSYKKLRSIALGIVLDDSEQKEELHFIRGALIDLNGVGIVIMGSSDYDIATHTFLLLEMDRARIHSNDWIYVEHLGGEKGRISTLISERKFLIHKDISQISQRLRLLYEKCKKENDYFILDPLWIEGKEKYINTTRIRVLFILKSDPTDKTFIKRLTKKEFISFLTNTKNSFLNPHTLINSSKRIDLEIEFYKNIFQYCAVYRINTSKPLFEVQKTMKGLINSKAYLQTFDDFQETIKIELNEALKKIDLQKIKTAIQQLPKQKNVISPSPEEIKKMAEFYGQKTKFENFNFVSTVKNRSAGLTVYIGTEEVWQRKLNPKQIKIIRDLPDTIYEVLEYIKKAPLIMTERTMGNNPYFTPKCSLFVSNHRKEMVRLAYMMNQSLFDLKENSNPELNIVYIPEWQEKDRQILVFPEIGVTFVLGTDYYGEVKKGMLRMAMWFVKKQAMLGLHAGAKIIKARDAKTGQIKKYSVLIFGLTATGKTTHSCHNHNLAEEKGEGIEIVQDDFVALREDGSAIGTERGFFLKTEGLNPEIQPLIYNAITAPDGIFENVLVDYMGNVFFEDDTLTGNGRGIMQRDRFGKYKSEIINLPPLSEVDGLIIFNITRRNTVVPIASKLTLEQGAAAFLLGESIESSGSNPERAGESVRVVGTNPFIVGSEEEEANIFYDLIRRHGNNIQCYLLNTGGVGEIMIKNEDGTKTIKRKVERVAIKEMAAIIRGIVRNNVTWKKESNFGTLIPEKIEDVDIERFNLKKFYTQEEIKKMVEQLKKERREYIEHFSKLKPEIKNAVNLN